jgi:hypothetical protein
VPNDTTDTTPPPPPSGSKPTIPSGPPSSDDLVALDPPVIPRGRGQAVLTAAIQDAMRALLYAESVAYALARACDQEAGQ